MTERDALLAAILSSPEDDTPRMIYADWLEERGDVERAEFVRGTIARGLKASAEKRDGGWFVHGRNGHTILADLLESELATMMPTAIVGSSVVYRRGFIDSITISWADWLCHYERLFWSPRQTVECPVTLLGNEPIAHQAADCDVCNGTGRIPRPFVNTAQPIETVRLTTWPTDLDERAGSTTDGDFLIVARYRFDRVKCSTCDGQRLIRSDGYGNPSEIQGYVTCPDCHGTPLNLWECKVWPGVQFVMPEENGYAAMMDEAIRQVAERHGIPPHVVR